MFKKWIWIMGTVFTLFCSGNLYAAKHKTKSKKQVDVKTTAVKHNKSKGKKAKSAGKGKKSKVVKGKHGLKTIALETSTENVHTHPMQLIAQNKEKSRIDDSVHKAYFANATKEIDEGFFASSFATQKKANSFQTIEGTASVFKSLSGWEDKKFYVLTNELPVGTIVRVTTSDLKSICAKVINVLPEVGNAIQYRLNDAAVAILGITSKTFQVSVTY
ncbi:MAG: hypothetical protein RLZ56_1070 [Bacteroidota bacterium]|jgi:hypothetical protein